MHIRGNNGQVPVYGDTGCNPPPICSNLFPPPMGHRYMQDHDPKHTSRHVQKWIIDNNINWWQTPAESPDMNPIENLWHEMKEYIRREVKPRTKDELVQGIKDFWSTVDVQKCTK